jgi:hypothetical protein
MRYPSIAAALAVAALLVSTAALADDPGADEVSLKNGGTIRGTVVSSEPGTSVKILEMGAKEPRTIPWSQVSDVERGKYTPRAEPQPGAAGPGYIAPSAPLAIPAPEPQLGEMGVVRLHIESPEPVQIFEHAAPQIAGVGGYAVVIDNSRLVCASPCDRVIDGRLGQRFSARGDFPGVKSFTLSGFKDDLSLDVKPGSNGMRTGGVWATTLGGIGLLTGLTTFLLGSAFSSIETSSSGSGTKTAGVGIMVGSGVVLAGGIVLLATSGTSFRLHPTGAAPSKEARARYWLGEF